MIKGKRSRKQGGVEKDTKTTVKGQRMGNREEKTNRERETIGGGEVTERNRGKVRERERDKEG